MVKLRIFEDSVESDWTDSVVFFDNRNVDLMEFLEKAEAFVGDVIGEDWNAWYVVRILSPNYEKLMLKDALEWNPETFDEYEGYEDLEEVHDWIANNVNYRPRLNAVADHYGFGFGTVGHSNWTFAIYLDASLASDLWSGHNFYRYTTEDGDALSGIYAQTFNQLIVELRINTGDSDIWIHEDSEVLEWNDYDNTYSDYDAKYDEDGQETILLRYGVKLMLIKVDADTVSAGLYQGTNLLSTGRFSLRTSQETIKIEMLLKSFAPTVEDDASELRLK